MKSLEHDNWFCLLYLQHGFSINKIHVFTFDIVQLIRLKCQTMKLKVIYCSRSSGWVCVFFFCSFVDGKSVVILYSVFYDFRFFFLSNSPQNQSHLFFFSSLQQTKVKFLLSTIKFVGGNPFFSLALSSSYS